MQLWHPEAIHRPDFSDGIYAGSSMEPNCLCLHSTEGYSLPGYRSGAVTPHFTFRPDFANKRLILHQHLPINRSARALENRAGGVQTNTAGVVQVELEGTCDSQYATSWGTRKAGVDYIYWENPPTWAIRDLAKFIVWLDKQAPKFKIEDAPKAVGKGWRAYRINGSTAGGSYGATPNRFTFTEWAGVYGIFGHQHVPENGHGDPGRLPIAPIVATAIAHRDGTVPPPVVVDPPDPTLPPTTYDKMAPASYFAGVIGEHVTWYGQRVVLWSKALGLPSPYSVGPGPEWGPADERGTQALQPGGDGFPGAETLARLATDPPPTPPPPPNTAVWGVPSTWAIGATGPDVTRLGQRLVLWAAHLGLPQPYQVGPGPEFTDTDRNAVATFQTAQGWSGVDADGFPGPETFKRLAANPPVGPKISQPVEYISANLAAYDTVGKGKRTRVARAGKEIPNYLVPKRPTWFHFQECSADMLTTMDRKFSAYTRVPEGGLGRESYYRKDAGIKILEARLLNVKHMLLKDTKEHLVIAWEDARGFRGVYVNFHNENEGSTFQTLQLRDCMNAGIAMCDRHGIDRRNLVVTGDSNLRTAATFVRGLGWRESVNIAVKKIDLIYKTTNGWLLRVVQGGRIDVDVFRPGAYVDEAEVLFGALISDHWPHRVIHRLIK